MARCTAARSRNRASWALTLTMAAMSAPAALQEPPALVVEHVASDSPAARVGLKPGDLLASYDQKRLRSPAGLQAAEENTFNKDAAALEVQRGAETMVLIVPRGRLGIRVRPPLSSVALTLYEGRESAQGAHNPEDLSGWIAAARAAQEAVDIVGAAWLHTRVGEAREGRRQWREASEAHAAALTLLKQSDDAAALSRTLVALGRCSESVNDFPAALGWYEQAEKVDAAAGNEMWAAGDLAAQGGVALSRGDVAAAQSYQTRALGIRERLAPGSLAAAASLHSLGEVAYSRGDLAAAQDYFGRALKIREQLAPGSLEGAASLHGLGNVAFRRGDRAAAQDAYTRALDIRERLAPGSLDVASSLNNLGNLAVERGDLASAESHYRRALDIRERLAPGSLSVATTLSNLGVATNARGNLVSAEEYYRRSLEIRERLAPESLDVASSLTTLGWVAAVRGDVAAAEDYHRRALGINERLAPNSLSLALSLFNLGGVSRDRGDLAAAADYFNRSLRIREQLAPNSLSVAIVLQYLGKVARDRGEFSVARQYQSRALALHERLAPGSPYIGVALNEMGLVAWSLGDLAAAQDYLGRALVLREHLAPNSLDVAESLSGLGGIALEQRRLDEALALFARGVEIVESQRWQVRSAEARALLSAQHTETYGGLMRTQLALRDVAAAFATAERSRARSLLETLAEARTEIRQGVDLQLLARERAIQQEINDTAYLRSQLPGSERSGEQAATLQQKLNALLIEFRDVQSELRIKSPRYAALMQPQPLGLAEIQQQLLDAQTLLLEYVLGEDGRHVFAVTPTSIQSFDLPRRADIERAARRMYESVVARQPVRGESSVQRRRRIEKADAQYPAAAAALSRMVLGPVSDQLSDKRLLIVPDGALQYVPFSALLEPAADASASAIDRPPLMVAHEIVSVPSASVLAVLRRELGERRPAERLVGVLADPVFDAEDPRLKKPPGRAIASASRLPADVERAVRGAAFVTDRGTLSRLPFTRDEADAILALAPARQGARAIDFDASRATITSAGFAGHRIVHLATHGVLNTEHPELSGIVLSLVDEQGRPQDGFLRLHEVYNLNWSAELVVLSACQTALGQEIKGEGLVGLTRGFMYGGAKRVVASLWNVNDGATAQFMKHFYRGLLAGGSSPAAALRAAQIETWKRRQWRSPYYWAPFVLQGEWR